MSVDHADNSSSKRKNSPNAQQGKKRNESEKPRRSDKEVAHRTEKNSLLNVRFKP